MLLKVTPIFTECYFITEGGSFTFLFKKGNWCVTSILTDDTLTFKSFQEVKQYFAPYWALDITPDVAEQIFNLELDWNLK